MKLIFEATGKEVHIGDRAITSRGRTCTVTAIQRPRNPASTGLVYLAPNMIAASRSQGYYPSVIGAVWIEREDQQ